MCRLLAFARELAGEGLGGLDGTPFGANSTTLTHVFAWSMGIGWTNAQVALKDMLCRAKADSIADVAPCDSAAVARKLGGDSRAVGEGRQVSPWGPAGFASSSRAPRGVVSRGNLLCAHSTRLAQESGGAGGVGWSIAEVAPDESSGRGPPVSFAKVAPRHSHAIARDFSRESRAASRTQGCCRPADRFCQEGKLCLSECQPR